MFLLFISFVAGVLTVLAPCVLPVLPIIIGGAAQDHRRRNPYIITASLAVAVVLFTLLLKFSTLFINIPPEVWSYTSGTIIIFFGLITIFPNFWDKLNFKLGLSAGSDKILNSSAHQSGRLGDMLIGLSLGPVFSSCSPTYFLILATVLPQSFGKGIADLIAYAVGLSLVLLLVSLLGQKFIARVKVAADPRGIFKRALGILFLLVGIFIFTGADKKLQVFLADHGWSGVSAIEQNLLGRV
ncbi:MAG: cytochrome C biogenesis protein, partial [Candidatus Magasanikbacteria bacterium]|nr:cytochrome C biogenesis protein [Candidatus Magasanikbacteria bacterium]